MGTFEGKTLGGYSVGEQLGHQGFGAVHRATDRRGNPVALKILAPAIENQRDAEVRFKDELEAARAVSSSYVARPLAWDLDEEPPWIAYQLVSGETLWKRQSEGVSPASFLDLARQLAIAVVDMHRDGVKHRDLTPDNVMVTDEGRLFVIDLGIALYPGKDRYTGGPIGKLPYMAPEQLGDSERIGRPSDIWAVGGLLTFLWSGRRPFSVGDLSPVQYHQKLITEAPVLADLPPVLCGLVSRCLQAEPADRPVAEQVRAYLEATTEEDLRTTSPRTENGQITSSLAFVEAVDWWISVRGLLQADLTVVPTPLGMRPVSDDPVAAGTGGVRIRTAHARYGNRLWAPGDVARLRNGMFGWTAAPAARPKRLDDTATPLDLRCPLCERQLERSVKLPAMLCPNLECPGLLRRQLGIVLAQLKHRGRGPSHSHHSQVDDWIANTGVGDPADLFHARPTRSDLVDLLVLGRNMPLHEVFAMTGVCPRPSSGQAAEAVAWLGAGVSLASGRGAVRVNDLPRSLAQLVEHLQNPRTVRLLQAWCEDGVEALAPLADWLDEIASTTPKSPAGRSR